MQFPRYLHVLAAVLFLPAFAAHADTVTTFHLTNTNTASGTVTIDTTTGAVQAIDLSFPTLLSSGLIASTLSQSYGPPLNLTDLGETWLGQPGLNYYADITLAIPVATLVGYAGGNICSLDHPCANELSSINIGNFQYNDFADGTLTATPEPSSFTLILEGAIAILGIMRGRSLGTNRSAESC